MDAAQLADSLLRERVLVFGSLPPGGRDLDLLVRPAAQASLRAGLPTAGFLGREHEWVRFARCSVEAIDLVAAASWRLPEDELEALFAEAREIDGLQRLVRPAPHHALLILARRGQADGGLADKHIGRARGALAEEPAALELARSRARMWAAEEPLETLSRALATGAWAAADGAAAALRARARRLAHRRAGVLVTLSGLDGSGKSTQARALAETLDRLGYSCVVVWTSVTAHGALPRVAGAVRALLRLLSRRQRGAGPAGAVVSDPPRDGGPDPVRALRERSRLARWTWTMFVAATNGWWQWRATGPHLLRGRVVICDRYTLDSKVHLRYAYGERRRYRAQVALIRLLSPRPSCAFLLDVSPQAAYARNQEYSLQQTQLRARLYREEHAALGVLRLDGELAREEICAAIASEVWRAAG